jgi:hypothetical protein
MKIIYHLPNIIYNHSNSCFEGFTYNEAVGYLKLIYKNTFDFQKHFLSKLENIPNLQKLCIDLGYSFEKAKPLSKSEIETLKNKEDRDFALEHFNGIYNKPKEENKPKKSFFDNYVQKIKDYLDNAEKEEIVMPFYNTSIVDNKKPFLITKIEKYFINEEKEFIHFNAKNVNEIELNNTIKHFLCPECDINKLILNDGLIYLDACRNNITHIQLNENLTELDITDNELTELRCNSKLRRLFVTNNKLKFIQLNKDLEKFVANGNNLKVLELNSNLQVAYLLNNPLQHIFINKNLKELSISHPENKNIEIDNSVENNQVEINYFIN